MTAKNEDPTAKMKKLEELIAKKKAELLRERGRLSEQARKNRMRRLIQVGELAEWANVLDQDNGFLLGVLLRAKEIAVDSPEWQAMKAAGDKVLQEREAKRKTEALKESARGTVSSNATATPGGQ
jgi:hypothetical protein